MGQNTETSFSIRRGARYHILDVVGDEIAA
jgi:hypothetical protein